MFAFLVCNSNARKYINYWIRGISCLEVLNKVCVHGIKNNTLCRTLYTQWKANSVPLCNVIGTHLRCFNKSSCLLLEETEEVINENDAEVKNVDPSKDRSEIIPPEVSIGYMESKAYQTTYENLPVFTKYRRNFKGHFPPEKTRRTCIKKNVLATGNPCPICRDKYLVLHYTNIKLLKQFICPHSGEIYEPKKSGLCRKQHMILEVAIEQARDRGLLTFHVPFRRYDYSLYYPGWTENSPVVP